MKRDNQKKIRDSFLEERLERTDKWKKEGKIPNSSKVIPIQAAFSPKQWVMPTEQVVEILGNARVFALTDCECRTRYRRCSNPLNVCFLINDAADLNIKQGKAKLISLEEARKKLKIANDSGLVHLTIYNPEQQVFAICSCCACCCHDLQFLKCYNRGDLISHSDYQALTDMDLCTNCGICSELCIFNLRIWGDNHLKLNEQDCYGCGLCVPACPEEAITMTLRDK
jgi:NAD-dependent dihydropyrimidine dehydrogenase PreA subunit